MKKIITFVLVLYCFSAFAQWDVNPHLFESNMTVTNAIFDFDTNTVNNDSLQIVAFSGTECRGYVPFFNPHTINGQNAYFYFLMIHGQSGDSIQICVWDNASQSFWYKSPVFNFENDTIMGTPFTPNILYAGYKVTFDANGGSGAMPYQHFHHETAQNLSPNTFSRIGMHFAGWSGTPNGSVEYTDGAIGTIVWHGWQLHRSIEFLTGDTDTAALIVYPAGLFVTTADKGMRVVHLEIGQKTVLKANHHSLLIHIIYARTSIHEVRTQATAVDADATVEHIVTHIG